MNTWPKISEEAFALLYENIVRVHWQGLRSDEAACTVWYGWLKWHNETTIRRAVSAYARKKATRPGPADIAAACREIERSEGPVETEKDLSREEAIRGGRPIRMSRQEFADLWPEHIESRWPLLKDPEQKRLWFDELYLWWQVFPAERLKDLIEGYCLARKLGAVPDAPAIRNVGEAVAYYERKESEKA